MSRTNKALAVIVVASLGLWGCARGPGNGAVTVERIRALETKIAKLEDDFHASVVQRDQLKKKLAAAEEERAQFMKDRDELKHQLNGVQDRFDQFRKGVKDLLGQAEQPLSPVAQPLTSMTPSAAAGNF
jgi:septal ring factor EnvC (AmiA/AmiB activator)